jgi:ubiquitin-protein ligase E3 A
VFADDWLKCGLWKEKLVDTCTACHAAGNWSKLIRLIGATFRDSDRLVGNFLPKEAISSMEADADKDVDEFAMSTDSISENEIQPMTSSKDALLAVDISRVHDSFDYLFGIDKHFSLPELPFTSALATAVEALAANMPKRLVSNMASYANALVVLMELPISAILELDDRVVPCLCLIAERLPVDLQARLATLWSKGDATRLHDMVHPIQQYVTMQVITNSWSRDILVNDDPNITAAIKLLKIFYYASILGGRVTALEVREMERKLATADPKTPAEMLLDILQRMDGASASGSDREELMKREDDPLERQLGITRLDCREPLIPLNDFINEPLSDVIEMDKDYLYYRTEAADNKFTFMLHPFMLTTLTKNLAMYFDNRIRMLQERRQSFIQTFIGGQISLPHLRLHIRRDHIIDDALVAVSCDLDFRFVSLIRALWFHSFEFRLVGEYFS